MERNRLNNNTVAQQNKVISKKPTGVFYIDGNKAFYFETMLSSPISLDIPAEMMANFEILNKKKLTTHLASFIKNYKLVPKNIVILLSGQVTFDKDFPHGSIEVQKNIQEFLELVPFEETLDKKIVASGKTRVVATNKEVCDAIKNTFTSAGFLVSGIYPLSLCMEAVPQLKTNLDLNLFVNKVTDLKTYNLQPIVEAAIHPQGATPRLTNEKPNKSRFLLLVGVFLFLILILGWVVYSNIISPSDETPQVLPTPTLSPVTPTPVVRNEQPVVEEPELETIIPEGTVSATSPTTGSN